MTRPRTRAIFGTGLALMTTAAVISSTSASAAAPGHYEGSTSQGSGYSVTFTVSGSSVTNFVGEVAYTCGGFPAYGVVGFDGPVTLSGNTLNYSSTADYVTQTVTGTIGDDGQASGQLSLVYEDGSGLYCTSGDISWSAETDAPPPTTTTPPPTTSTTTSTTTTTTIPATTTTIPPTTTTIPPTTSSTTTSTTNPPTTTTSTTIPPTTTSSTTSTTVPETTTTTSTTTTLPATTTTSTPATTTTSTTLPDTTTSTTVPETTTTTSTPPTSTPPTSTPPTSTAPTSTPPTSTPPTSAPPTSTPSSGVSAVTTDGRTTFVQGSSFVVVGRGFLPGEQVTGVLNSDPIQLGTQVADAAGDVRFTVAVPTTFPAGAHTVTLTGAQSGTAALAITVSATADLPATGSTSAGLAILAAGVFLTGGSLILVGRRRTA
ncbi:LPXTG cell wall anchor domain-containing protein [Desertimonas flava]|uniref:LPXTG cell wall anchor domain-containing protein n=1 Tax=Desertimonas flava TaxID=2064846 RepID=UPI0023F1A8F0|nr:LPXTG cell wall anchor domain-containing protein [Desertimonas flava]